MPTSSKSINNSSEAVAHDTAADDLTGETDATRSRFRITHRTRYSFSEPANRSSNELRLQPVSSPWQTVKFFLLTIRPATNLRHFTDMYRTVVHFFELEENHNSLLIQSNAVVETRRKIDFDAFPYGSAMSELGACEQMDRCHDFLLPSHYTEDDPAIWKYAIDARDTSSDVFETAYNIMQAIHRDFDYQPGSTHVRTTAAEAYRDQSGVCQDFAHVGIAMCRLLGIPARYVSGYLFDPLHDALRGTQASHAWFEVFLPNQGGWFGLDPTNNKVVDENYIVLATGRDYSDVAPVEGSFYGGGTHRSLDVSVEVIKLDG